MKNYVSFNAKYYKNSNASGEIGHVQRVFKENTNAIEHLTKNNFGCGYNIHDKYKATYKQVEEIKGKKIQENSNTFMDGVLSFSKDQIEKMMKEDPNWKKNLSNHIEQFMQDVKKETGLEPLGWEMHMDEGTAHPDGTYSMNYHAQLIFFNFDFETKKAPLRDLMGRKSNSIWSKLQDLAGERFAPLGFQRGISAEMTKAKHKEKDKFIEEKQAKLEQKIELLEEQLDHQHLLLEKQQTLVDSMVEKVQDLKENYNLTVDFVNNTLDKEKNFEKNAKVVKKLFNEYEVNPKFKKTVDFLIGVTKKLWPGSSYDFLESTFYSVKNYFTGSEDPKYDLSVAHKIKEDLDIVKTTLYSGSAEIKQEVEEIKKKKNKLRI